MRNSTRDASKTHSKFSCCTKKAIELIEQEYILSWTVYKAAYFFAKNTTPEELQVKCRCIEERRGAVAIVTECLNKAIAYVKDRLEEVDSIQGRLSKEPVGTITYNKKKKMYESFNFLITGFTESMEDAKEPDYSASEIRNFLRTIVHEHD